MYKIHPRNLTLGPFMTLLLTLGRRGQLPASRAGPSTRNSRLSETAPANAHEAALHHCVANDNEEDRGPFTLGPFLTLILTVRPERCRWTARAVEEKGSSRDFCRRPSCDEDTS